MNRIWRALFFAAHIIVSTDAVRAALKELAIERGHVSAAPLHEKLRDLLHCLGRCHTHTILMRRIGPVENALSCCHSERSAAKSRNPAKVIMKLLPRDPSTSLGMTQRIARLQKFSCQMVVLGRSFRFQQQKGLEAFTAQLKEQAAQLQKVSNQIEVSRLAPRVAANKP